MNPFIIASGFVFANSYFFKISTPKTSKELAQFLIYSFFQGAINTILTESVSYFLTYNLEENTYSEAVYSSVCVNLLNTTYTLLSNHQRLPLKDLTNKVANISEAATFFSRSVNALMNFGSFDFSKFNK